MFSTLLSLFGTFPKMLLKILGWVVLAGGLMMAIGKFGERFSDYLPIVTRQEYKKTEEKYKKTLEEVKLNNDKIDKIDKSNKVKRDKITQLDQQNKILEEKRKFNRELLKSAKGNINKLDSIANEIL